ncbi:deoxyribodipyrimidine photo-lyase [Sutcliffiella sp. BMC8]|uniref:cryptochrome/photolyase family protein n=2 Tax=unclassified Sutcliffiella TaxID=2837532 RepID=UPI0030D1A4E2
MTLSVMWFRRDFRLQDNTALYHAVKEAQKRKEPILFMYHLDPKFTSKDTPNHRFFFTALQEFIKHCEAKGIFVHVIVGTWKDAFSKLLDHFPDMTSLYFNKDEVGEGHKRDNELERFLNQKNIRVRSFDDYNIHHANEVKKADNSIYKVFTPYFKKWNSLPKKAPVTVNDQKIKNNSVKDDGLYNKGVETLSKTIKKLPAQVEISQEEQAFKLLQSFLKDKVDHYDRFRDLPAANGTSKLSVFLRTGAISARTILYLIQEKQLTSYSTGMDTFVKELAWRDFYNMIYHHYPNSKSEEIEVKYHQLDWSKDENLLQKWKEGNTGFPIVDAGMRQLKQEGWMHNRLRMITASFLTKDLLMDWRIGELYFEEMLHDYDESSNIGGWQWAASVGTDAVPYFRIFNPITQSIRFDHRGEYIKKYVPELSRVPEAFIHEPSNMNKTDQKKANCIIGKDYPEPIVDHSLQRKSAIQMFKDLT